MKGFLAALSLVVLAAGVVIAGPGGAKSPSYKKEIRPLLGRHCVSCHGGGAQLGGLRLDSPTHIKKGGVSGAVVLPGNAKRSPLVGRMKGKGPQMPPEEKVPHIEISKVEAWIDTGAKYD